MLIHFNLDGCELNKQDIDYLYENRRDVLPCLTSLRLDFQKVVPQLLQASPSQTKQWFLAY